MANKAKSISLNDLVVFQTIVAGEAPHLLLKATPEQLRDVIRTCHGTEATDDEIKALFALPASTPIQNGAEWTHSSDLTKIIENILPYSVYAADRTRTDWAEAYAKMDVAVRKFLINDFVVAILGQNGMSAADVDAALSLIPSAAEGLSPEEKAIVLQERNEFLQQWVNNEVPTVFKDLVEITQFDLVIDEPATEAPANIETVAEEQTPAAPTNVETVEVPTAEEEAVAEPEVVAEEPTEEVATETEEEAPITEITAEEEPAPALPAVPVTVVAPAPVTAEGGVVIAPENHQKAMGGLAKAARAASELMVGIAETMEALSSQVKVEDEQ